MLVVLVGGNCLDKKPTNQNPKKQKREKPALTPLFSSVIPYNESAQSRTSSLRKRPSGDYTPELLQSVPRYDIFQQGIQAASYCEAVET